ncbi:glycosyltransferase family 4 protein [Oceanobacillus profundus]|uniref:glycosyltransferase family 4 protein n=1 Tax=Oceanobacillus profundus TaxID=372463 RepID=UPI00363CBE01
MNIWIFNHYAVDPKSSGGTRHYDLAYQLIKRGHKVTIFASSYNHFIKKETVSYDKGMQYKKESVNGVDYVWINTTEYIGTAKRILNILDYTRKSYKTAKKELGKNIPDIVIGSSVHPLAAYIGYLISKKVKKPYYFEERDLWPQTFVDFGKVSARNPIVKLLYRFESFLYKKADRIIVLFNKAPDYVYSRGINKSKVIYLPNGVNLDSYKEVQKDESLFEELQQHKYKVIYTGSHGIANHLEPFIDTANIIQNKMKITDIQFVLVGNGLLKEKLIRQAKSYKLSNITFLDSIPKEKIPYLLSQADLSFISLRKSPLYKWGFSMNKIYDYMASGLPIMMYSTKEIVGEFSNINGVELSESPEELAENILSSIYNEDFKLEANKSLKGYVEGNFDWNKLAIMLEEKMLEDSGKEK